MANQKSTTRPDTHDEDLGAQVAQLQEDVAAIAASLGLLAERGVSELSQSTQDSLAGLVREGQALSADMVARLRAIEARLESSVRTQPMIAIGLAGLVGFLLSELVRRR